MYGEETSLREKIVNDYGPDLDRLLRYLPYLDKKKGKDVQNFYDGEANYQSIPVPIYDSTLLAFIKEAKKSAFMYKNYPYVYRKYHLNTHADEIKLMEEAMLRDIDIYRGIISKYVLGGQTKAYLWSEAVDARIFVTALDCLQKRFAEFNAELSRKGL